MLPEYLITRLENIWRLAHSAPKNIVLGGTAEDQIKQVVQEMQQSHVARAWIFITHASMCHAAHRVFETRWKEVHVDLRSDGGSGSLEGKAKKVAKEEFAAANLRVDGLTPTPKAIRKDEQRWLRLFAYGKHMAALATAFGPDDIRPCNAILIAIPFEQLGKLGKTRDNSQIPRYVWEWLKKRFGDEDVKPCLSRVCQVAQEYSEDGVILRRMSLHPRNPNPEEDVNLPDVDQDSVPDRIKDIRSYTVFRHRLVRICQESKVCVPKRFPDVVSADETDPTDLLLELRSTEADSEMMYQYHNVVLNRDIPCELPYAEIDNFFRPGGLSLSSRAVSAVLTAATTESDWLLVRSSELRKASSEPKPDRDGRWTYPIDKYLVVFCPNVVLDAHSYPLKSPEAILTRLNAASKGNESSDSHTSHNSGIPASPVQYREEWDALKMDSKILMAVFMFKGNKNAAVHVINPLADYVAMATQRDDLARTEKLVRDWLPSCVESITFTEVSVPKPASKDENDLCVILHGLSILRTGSVYPVQVTKEITEQYLPHFGKHLICSGKRK
ncbi:hypothetical protein GE09DRAFT_1122460 [Coniochaeta sp. 2T2.1]|nr:hypothetical protein GE09DRAFT_1122460 [Coniochaeta sp. 2T2.1]